MTAPKTVFVACALFLGYIPCLSHAQVLIPETTHTMDVGPSSPGVCSLTSKFDGEAHKITISWKGPADPEGAAPINLEVSSDGLLWAVGPAPATPTTAEVRAVTYARDDYSATFTVKKKKPATNGGGGGGSANDEGKGYANQVQIHAYAPSAGAVNPFLRLPRPDAQDTNKTYYGILAPYAANQPTSLELVFNSKNKGIGKNSITLNLPSGVDAPGFQNGDTIFDSSTFALRQPLAVRLKDKITTPQIVKLKLENENGSVKSSAEDSVTLLPVEFEIKHIEKNRDDEGNELTTTINPGPTTLLRDEIAELRIKVPTIRNTDWSMTLDLEPEGMKNQTLDSRGSVQMYDFGKVDNDTIIPLTTNANGSLKAGPYDITLPHAKNGDETFRIVVNKEGTFKLRLKSAANNIDVTSQEFTVTNRIRKYARRPENNNADFDKHDKAFIDAAAAWGAFYNNPLDPDILKAMGMQESTLGYGATPTVDILTINYGGNDQDHVLAILHNEHTANEKEAIPGGDSSWTIRWLDYDNAAANSARVAIHWGACWLFHKAQKGRMVSDPNSPPHYVTFGGWNSWEDAVGFYGPNPVYRGVIEGPWKRGRRDSTTGKVGGVWKKIDFAESNYQYLWPILSNQQPRK